MVDKKAKPTKTVSKKATAKPQLQTVANTQAPTKVSLSDKYNLNVNSIYVSGSQAVVRMLMMQSELDKAQNLNTAGFVCGYRGSPIAGLDQQVVKAEKFLKPRNIIFQAGLNEDLAATACWGSQQAEIRGDGAYDGVYAVWYGKGPGVDRTGDVFRHANMAGSSKFGGVLALMGDDHTCESSTVAHQSDFALIDAMFPILSPANVQEMIDYGLYGFALSRFAGVWVGLKCLKDNIEQTASVDGDLSRIKINIPKDFKAPKDGLNIRLGDNPLDQEKRLFGPKMDAIKAFVRANALNTVVLKGGPKASLGIATSGKNYLDVLEALQELGIDEVAAANLGIRLYKVGCTWPLEPTGALEFTKGLSHILVVEEKRALIEAQLKDLLYHDKNAPKIEGKQTLDGQTLFTPAGGLDPLEIAIAIGERVLRIHPKNTALSKRVTELKDLCENVSKVSNIADRVPSFCSGCPHNTSTKVPEGMRASAGIGCHYMVQWMERSSEGVTQMGGEGANWVGEGQFSKRPHIFQNLGDGTYNHSGSTAIRFALSSNLNITYKILYNDAVAMTGGQPIEGGLTVPMIANQVAAEGVKRIVLVTNEPEKYDGTEQWPQGMTIHPRDEFDALQLELAQYKGVSVLIFDQTCAAEKRRRRKRGEFPDPDKRVFINPSVCEGCGDCGVQSNCVSIQPLETAFGRKRTIDQTSCNKDFSCVKGFCPSFVTVEGARLKAADKSIVKELSSVALPEVPANTLAQPWNIIITGIGGTGVTTVAAVLGMAAHVEGKGVGIIDMAGLAQKGGAVYSHMRIAASPEKIKAIRVGAGQADLVLGGDLVVSSQKKVITGIKKNGTYAVVNTAIIYPGDFSRHTDYTLPVKRMQQSLEKAGAKQMQLVDLNALSNRLFGNTVAANMMMVGIAYQMGGMPLSAQSIEDAIALNGQAVEMNLQAFRIGRRFVLEPHLFEVEKPYDFSTETLDQMLARRSTFLTGYQNEKYAQTYLAQVNKIKDLEQKIMPGKQELTKLVSRYLFKVMAYKDEYEVARLYTNGEFTSELSKTFDGDLKITFHLAPPLFAPKDKVTGHGKKVQYGSWMLSALKVLAKLKVLRNTPFDIFGFLEERKQERALIQKYNELIALFEKHLSAKNYDEALALAAIPEEIRGYGHVKEKSLKFALEKWQKLEQAFLNPQNKSVGSIAAE